MSDEMIGDECEAFLAGRWGAELRRTGAPVPRWAWLNQVAHGTPEELMLLVRHLAGTLRFLDEERWAAGFVAAELVGVAARTGRPVAELQRVLVEQELALLTAAAPWRGIGHLVLESRERLLAGAAPTP